MIWLTYLGAMILAWSLGKNNLGNLFGTAVGTRMVRLKTAAVVAGIAVLAGALVSGAGTTASVAQLGQLDKPEELLVVIFTAFFVQEVFSLRGTPTSLMQTMIGALVGWNIARAAVVDWPLMRQMAGAWLMAPMIASIISGILMFLCRRALTRWPVSLFIRDSMVRVGLVLACTWAAYALGANNVGTIVGPYLEVYPNLPAYGVIIVVCIFVGIGFLMANKKVIATVSSRLFPLSPVEALVVMAATAVSLFCFSLQEWQEELREWHLPAFPLVPIPVSGVIIGAICGISLARGGYGLRFGILGRIILSWFLVPVVAGGLSWGLLILMRGMG